MFPFVDRSCNPFLVAASKVALVLEILHATNHQDPIRYVETSQNPLSRMARNDCPEMMSSLDSVLSVYLKRRRAGASRKRGIVLMEGCTQCCQNILKRVFLSSQKRYIKRVQHLVLLVVTIAKSKSQQHEFLSTKVIVSFDALCFRF